MFDPSVTGKHGSSRKTFTRKEAEKITKTVRQTAREMRKEGAKGMFESGVMGGSADARIVKKAMEEEFAEQMEGQNNAKDVLRERAARRRELLRREMGLAANEKLVQNEESRREKYQKKLEHEIEQIVSPAKSGKGVATGSSSPAGATHIAGALHAGQSARPVADISTIAPSTPGPDAPQVPDSSNTVNDDGDLSANSPKPQAEHPIAQDGNEKDPDLPEDDSGELPDQSRINDNLPL